MPAAARDIARAVKGMAAEHGLKQQPIADAISRTQPYVSERISGKEPWDTRELSILAGLMGYEPLDFLAEVGRRSRPRP